MADSQSLLSFTHSAASTPDRFFMIDGDTGEGAALGFNAALPVDPKD
jgi:hypothetical protein